MSRLGNIYDVSCFESFFVIIKVMNEPKNKSNIVLDVNENTEKNV